MVIRWFLEGVCYCAVLFLASLLAIATALFSGQVIGAFAAFILVLIPGSLLTHQILGPDNAEDSDIRPACNAIGFF